MRQLAKNSIILFQFNSTRSNVGIQVFIRLVGKMICERNLKDSRQSADSQELTCRVSCRTETEGETGPRSTLQRQMQHLIIKAKYLDAYLEKLLDHQSSSLFLIYLFLFLMYYFDNLMLLY